MLIDCCLLQDFQSTVNYKWLSFRTQKLYTDFWLCCRGLGVVPYSLCCSRVIYFLCYVMFLIAGCSLLNFHCWWNDSCHEFFLFMGILGIDFLVLTCLLKYGFFHTVQRLQICTGTFLLSHSLEVTYMYWHIPSLFFLGCLGVLGL